MSKSFRQFKKVSTNKRNHQQVQLIYNIYDPNKTNNNHFEVRRYIADKILNDRKLTDAYKSLETIHDTYIRHMNNDAIQLRQRLENMLKQDVKKKSH